MIEIHQADCLEFLRSHNLKVNLTICDPPFNQNKDYAQFDDKQDPKQYWSWITDFLKQVRKNTVSGGSIYFMHREKNVEHVFRSLRAAKWTFQNMIVWRKMTRATPASKKLAKKYQVIIYASKGDLPSTHNNLYGTMPMLAWHKKDSHKGVLIDDLWYDIRELSAGFLSGAELIRDRDGKVSHAQQMPIALALRMILLSTMPHDRVLDPFLGTGTTLTVSKQSDRYGIGIENNPHNIDIAKKRLETMSQNDFIDQYYGYYATTKDIDSIWGSRQQRTLDGYL